MGSLFRAPALAIYAIGGLWGLIVTFAIVYKLLGFWVTALAFFIAPAILYLAPWYAAIFERDFFPIALIYGTTVLAAILYGTGELVDRRSRI